MNKNKLTERKTEKSRILFTIIPEKGHINPYIGVAKILEMSGYEVAYYAAADISNHLEKANLKGPFLGVQTVKSEGNSPSPQLLSNQGSEFAKHVANPDWLRTWIKSLLVDHVDNEIAVLNSIVDSFKPNLIIIDPMIYAAAITANMAHIPWVAISNSLNPVLHSEIKSELLDTVTWLEKARDELFQRHHMEAKFSGCDIISPHLTIAFTTQELIGPLNSDVHLVGPSCTQGARGDECYFPMDTLPHDVPIIYMSLGSQIYHQPAMFNIVFEAVKSKPVQLVASVNDLIDSSDLVEIPDNVILVHYAPQLSLLKKAAVMITHGGANSVMEAIQANVPILISPICNDQFHQAFYIEKQSIGSRLNLQECSSEECWDTLSTLLTSTSIKENLDRVHNSYKVNGSAQAAHLVKIQINKAKSNGSQS